MNNNHNNENNTVFKIKFPQSIQTDINRKFNYSTFLTQNHDTVKYRCGTYIQVVTANECPTELYGRFITNKTNWIFHIPRIRDISINENIEKNGIFSNFLTNLEKDIRSKNKADVFVVLANMYESLPKLKDNTLNFTFYKLLSINCIDNSFNLSIFPTFCYLARKLSQLKKTKCNKTMHTLFLNDIDIPNKYILNRFWNKFTTLIDTGYYNNLLNNFDFFYKNKENKNISKTIYNEKMKNDAINLIERCQIDNNSKFIYSNLGLNFFNNIVEPFKESNTDTIRLLFYILNDFYFMSS